MGWRRRTCPPRRRGAGREGGRTGDEGSPFPLDGWTPREPNPRPTGGPPPPRWGMWRSARSRGLPWEGSAPPGGSGASSRGSVPPLRRPCPIARRGRRARDPAPSPDGEPPRGSPPGPRPRGRRATAVPWSGASPGYVPGSDGGRTGPPPGRAPGPGPIPGGLPGRDRRGKGRASPGGSPPGRTGFPSGPGSSGPRAPPPRAPACCGRELHRGLSG